MLHLFDHKDEETQGPAIKKPALSRLQTVLAAGEKAAPEDRPSAPTRVAGNGDRGSAPPIWSRNPSPARPTDPPMQTPASEAEPQHPASEFGRFAEQFTKTFLGALSRAVEDIHASVTQDRGTLELLAREHRELSSRLSRIEERLAQQADAREFQALAEQLTKRLEAQAAAIRTLHAAHQAREERVEKLLAAFQGLHALAGVGSSSPAVDLPAEL